MNCELKGSILEVEVVDRGVGIEDVNRAMEPLYTTRPEWERSGMGFAFMEAFMDELEVFSEPEMGTTVRMYKKIGLGSWIVDEE
jgi:stage II sporulation protein AB (anti-sigma F factor)